MANLSEHIEAAKSNMTEPLPTPPNLEGKQANPRELLERLNWGEPALTIVDARDREAFNQERITGAVPLSMEQLPEGAEPLLEHNRDIYLYSDTAENAAAAANQLRQAGFQNVAEIKGGLSAWRDIGGPTEGVEAFSSPAQAEANS